MTARLAWLFGAKQWRHLWAAVVSRNDVDLFAQPLPTDGRQNNLQLPVTVPYLFKIETHGWYRNSHISGYTAESFITPDRVIPYASERTDL